MGNTLFKLLKSREKHGCFSWRESCIKSLIICLPIQVSPPGGYSHILPIRVCAAQRGRDFEAPDLERGIHLRGVF